MAYPGMVVYTLVNSTLAGKGRKTKSVTGLKSLSTIITLKDLFYIVCLKFKGKKE